MKKNEFAKEDAFKTLDTINMWINNCDSKVSIILATIGIISTMFFDSKLFEIISPALAAAFNNISGWMWLYSVFIWLSILSILVGIVFFVYTITPRSILTQTFKKRINKKYVVHEKEYSSFMFYGSIAKKTFAEYCKQMEKVTEEQIMEDLYFQINAAATICNSKFQNLKRGMLFFSSGLIVFIFLVFIYLI